MKVKGIGGGKGEKEVRAPGLRRPLMPVGQHCTFGTYRWLNVNTEQVVRRRVTNSEARGQLGAGHKGYDRYVVRRHVCLSQRAVVFLSCSGESLFLQSQFGFCLKIIFYRGKIYIT